MSFFTQIYKVLYFIISIISIEGQNTSHPQRPHIIFIIADDLGWNDVGFHGSNQIPTPNIDALAYSGLILNRYYVNAICTPSRSALMTAKYPIHTGMQHTVLFGAEPRGLPLNETLLPQYLKELGYTTRAVGKWHLGSYKREYTPLHRGFDSHLGYWTGHQDYYDHTAVERPGWGLDMRRNMDVAYDLHGKYSTDAFTDEAVRLIHTHNASVPLFLYLAHAATHSGNPYEPLRAPDAILANLTHVEDFMRHRFAGMLTSLDEGVGRVVEALSERNMLEDSLIVFTTDNGGAAGGFNLNAASNWPLRGVKNTLWEGGVRGAALLWSAREGMRGRVADQVMHIVDWMPTLLAAAGADTKLLGEVDGLNIWPSLTTDTPSVRDEILHNIDDIYGNAALTVGPWKILKGTTYNGNWDSWYGPSGRVESYNTSLIQNSDAGKALTKLNKLPTPEEMLNLRSNAEILCRNKENNANSCRPLEEVCLFNIVEDPCEMKNLAKDFPEIRKKLETILDRYNETAVPPGNLPLDPRGDPKHWNYTWTNFGDFIPTNGSSDNCLLF